MAYRMTRVETRKAVTYIFALAYKVIVPITWNNNKLIN